MRTRPDGMQLPALALFLVLTLVLAASTLAATGADKAHGASVSAHVRVVSALSATFSDDGVIVRANTGWRVEAIVPSSGQPMTVTGGPTSGSFIPLPKGTRVLSVVADS